MRFWFLLLVFIGCSGERTRDRPIAPQRPATCSNGVMDDGETGLDCGGPCVRCPPEAHACDDGRANGDETDVDCGGTCPACRVGQVCAQNGDCSSGQCENNICARKLTCTDAERSPGETDLDCGGPDCLACATGQLCRESRDCLSLSCVNGVCRDPSCDDLQKNQDESDLDCGGICAPCADGLLCLRPDDCASGRCDGPRCGSCQDNLQNGDETGPDCGGGCPACADGQNCGDPADCTSGRCDNNVCASCTDRQQSGYETDIDCGGGCPACADGQNCAAPADCQSGTCSAQGECYRCGAEEHICNNACVSNLAVATCGQSCTPCPAPSNGAATCDGNLCGATCNPGYHACGATCAADNDIQRCGAQCVTCLQPADATAVCSGGECAWTCNPGFYVCGGRCSATPCTWDRVAVPLSRAGARLDFAALAFDDNGVIHLAAPEILNNTYRVIYRARSGTNWVRSTHILATGSNLVANVQLAVRLPDPVWLAYLEGNNNQYAAYTARYGNNLDFDPIPAPAGIDVYGLTFDNPGNLWLGYQGTNFAAHIGRYTGAGWATENAVVGPTGLQRRGVELLVRADGGLSTLQSNELAGGLSSYRYAYRTTNGWVDEPLGTLDNYGFLAEHPDGRTLFVYYDTAGIQLRTRQNGQWGPPETVIAGNGRWANVAVSPNGVIWVTGTIYSADFTETLLHVAQRSPGGPWLSQNLGAAPPVFSKMATSGDGRVAFTTWGQGTELLTAR